MDAAGVGVDSSVVLVITVLVGGLLAFVFYNLYTRGAKLDARHQAQPPRKNAQGWVAASEVQKKYARSVDELFATCDRDGSGSVSKGELKDALKQHEWLMEELGLKRLKDATAFMKKADTDGNKKFDKPELRAYLQRLEASTDHAAEARARGIVSQKDLAMIEEVFQQMDAEGNGRISAAELAGGYLKLAATKGRKMKLERANRLAAKAHRRYDKDANGAIDMDEFVPMCLTGPFKDIFELKAD